MGCNKNIAKSEGCCRHEKKMVRCATTALKQMKDMFETAWSPITETPHKSMMKNAGCVIDTQCKIRECPFRGTGVAPNVLQTYCTKDDKRRGGGRSDRDAMRLLPGEVGLRGDRATFSLGRDDGLTHGGYSSDGGAVYYNIQPNMVHPVVVSPTAQTTVRGGGHSHVRPISPDVMPRDRKHVMEMLPTTAKPTLGPVTGLPVSDDEHVFVMWLGKRPGEPDEKARLQIEVRVPKRPPPVPVTPAEVTKVEKELPEEFPVKHVAKKHKKRANSKKSGNNKKSGQTRK